MSAKAQGTFVLDGLVEGPLPPLPAMAEKLNRWAAEAAGQQLVFHVQVEGGRFNMLAENEPRAVARLAGRIEDELSHCLGELLRMLPPAERSRAFSTVRSMEYRPGQEVQTLYAFGPDGRVQVQQQTVAAETVAPAVPLTRRQMLLRVGGTAAVIGALLGISTLFVPYGRMWQSMRRPQLPAAVAVEAPGLEEYLKIGPPALSADGATLLLPAVRSGAFPRNDEAVDAAARQATTRAATRPGSQVRTQLAIEALARGYVRVELYDEQGRFLTETNQRIAELREKETVMLAIPLPRDQGWVRMPGRVVVRY